VCVLIGCAAEAPPGKHQGRHRATKRTPRQELKWVQSQIERSGEPPRLTPREHQQVVQWNRPKREDRAMELAAQEILETAALPDKPQSYRYVWTKSEQGGGFSQKWMPMDQWNKERGSKFKLLAKAAKVTTGFGVGAGAGATVIGAGVAGVAKQTQGRPMVLSQDDPMAEGVEPPSPSKRVAKPSDECYHCKRLGHWKRDCPMLKPDYDYRTHQPEAVKEARRLLEKARYDQEDPHLIDAFERALQREEALYAEIEAGGGGPLTPRPPDQVRVAPLPPQLRGQRGEEAEAATKRIQKIHRGRQARRELNEQNAAAIRIQSIQRGKSARSQQQPPLHEPAPAPAPTPEVEVADEIIAAALEKGVVAAYDDMVEAAIAGVIDGSRKVLPLPPAPPEPEPEQEPEPELEGAGSNVAGPSSAIGSGREAAALRPTPPPPRSADSSISSSAGGGGGGGGGTKGGGKQPGAQRSVGFRGQTAYLSTASIVPGQRVTAYGPSARVASIAPSTHGLWPATASGSADSDQQKRSSRTVKFSADEKSDPTTATKSRRGGGGHKAGSSKTAAAASAAAGAGRAGGGASQSGGGGAIGDNNDPRRQKWRQHVPGPGGVKQMPGDKNHGSLG
jgi:hypothetical protein